jgi:hypothetical protein
MRGTGHRVLGNAHAGPEDAGHKIAVRARRGHRHATHVEGLQLFKVGGQRLHGLGAGKLHQIVGPGHQGLEDGRAQGLGQAGRRGDAFRRDRGEVHPDAPLALHTGQAPAAGVEAGFGGPQGRRAGQGRVAAKVHFGQRREPAQVPGAVGAGPQEGRFAQVELGGHALQPRVCGPSAGRQAQHGRRVAGKGLVAEGVDDVVGNSGPNH